MRMYVSNVSSSRERTKFDFVVNCRPRSCLRYVVWRSGRGCGLTLCVIHALSLSLFACRKRAQSVSRLKVFECDRICVWVCVCLCLQPESIKIMTPSRHPSLAAQSKRSFEHGQCTACHSLTSTWLGHQLQRKNNSYCVLHFTCYVLYAFFLPFVTVGSDIIHATQPETPPLPTPLAGLADSANIFWRDESRVSNEALLSNDIMLPKIAHWVRVWHNSQSVFTHIKWN